MRHLRSLCCAAVLVIGVVTAFAEPAAADRGGFAICFMVSCDSGAHSGDSSDATAPSGGGGGGHTDCWLLPLDVPLGTEVYDQGNLLGVADGTGAWFYDVCNGSQDGMLLSGNPIVFIPNPNPSPQALMQQALQHLTLPAPQILTNPPADSLQLVNLRTWLSVGGAWQTVTSTAAVAGVTVTVTALPSRVEWDLGDGHHVVCNGAGALYDESRPADEQDSSCTYRWPRSSVDTPDGTFHVTATIEWTASWTVTGAPGGGPLGGLRQSATRALRVGEAQARNS